MDFIYSIMAKTSATNTSTWGVPSGKLPIVLLPSVLGDTRRSHWLPGHLPRMLFCCILSLHASANWMTSLRVGPQTVHRQSLGGPCWEFPFFKDAGTNAHCDSSDGTLQSHCFGVWAWIGWLWNGFVQSIVLQTTRAHYFEYLCQIPQGHPTPSHKLSCTWWKADMWKRHAFLRAVLWRSPRGWYACQSSRQNKQGPSYYFTIL